MDATAHSNLIVLGHLQASGQFLRPLPLLQHRLPLGSHGHRPLPRRQPRLLSNFAHGCNELLHECTKLLLFGLELSANTAHRIEECITLHLCEVRQAGAVVRQLQDLDFPCCCDGTSGLHDWAHEERFRQKTPARQALALPTKADMPGVGPPMKERLAVWVKPEEVHGAQDPEHQGLMKPFREGNALGELPGLEVNHTTSRDGEVLGLHLLFRHNDQVVKTCVSVSRL
mmetsp:Transcript_62688/g.159414  ORF Transcript_62688/g.159414 Transcript_62688/m.159414 type:complete len:228 (-) Transcript_62688:598-1281(-)